MSNLMHTWSNRAVIEDSARITIQDLKTWGYLQPGKRTGTLTLLRRNEKTGMLGIIVNIDKPYNSYIAFDYLLNGEKVYYVHGIEFFPCHYGNNRYYFTCRNTGARVTALYFDNGYYASRHAHKMVYECSRSHKNSFGLIHKWQNLDRKAEWLEKNGHPRKAKKYFWKARYFENQSWGFMNKKWGIMGL